MKDTKKILQGLGLVLLLAFLCLTLFPMSGSEVSARPFRMAVMPDKGATFGCGVCHINPRGGGARNTFGKDYQKLGMSAGEKYTDELGAADSDGDGFDNNHEFKAGTHPGDPKSKPEK